MPMKLLALPAAALVTLASVPASSAQDVRAVRDLVQAWESTKDPQRICTMLHPDAIRFGMREARAYARSHDLPVPKTCAEAVKLDQQVSRRRPPSTAPLSGAELRRRIARAPVTFTGQRAKVVVSTTVRRERGSDTVTMSWKLKRSGERWLMAPNG